jgi:hypothetical protein
MWLPDRTKLLKVRLHSQGLDPETPWAEDCGPAPGPAGSRYVRIGNVPFLHAKPTYGDVIVVSPDEERVLSWDGGGRGYDEVCESLIEDSGRWVMILDYEVRPPAATSQEAFSALDIVGESVDIAVEGCFAPSATRPGRAYLAIPASMNVEQALALLQSARLPMSLTLVHPLEDDEG